MTPAPAPFSPRERVASAGIALLGAFAVLWRLGTPQVLPDEIVYLRAGASLLAGEGDPNLEHPPLAKALFGLAQSITGTEVLGGRLVTAGAALAIAALLLWLVRRIAGNRAGLLAAGLWVALPVAGGSSGPLGDAGRLDRFALLDPVATALAMAALAAGWSWLRRPTWQAAALTGLLGGLAAGAKPSGMLVLPAIAAVVLWTRRAQFPLPGAGVAVAVLASFAGLALAYAPLGSGAWQAFGHLVDFQSAHAADGHVVTVAGTTTAFPPWWSHLWFHVRDDGPVLTLLLFGGVVAAPLAVRGRDAAATRGVGLLLSALGVAFVALALSPVKLNFYRYLWWPLLVALLAIALDGAARRRVAGARLGADGFVAAAAAMALAVISVGHLLGVAGLRPGGYVLVAREVADTSGFVREAYEPMLIRGRITILDFYVEPIVGRPTARTDDLDEANAVLLDPEITSRFPSLDVEAVVGDADWTCEAFDTLTLCVRSAA